MIPDAYEVEEGLQLMLSDGEGDADGDRMKNRDEYVAGTRAGTPGSVLSITRVEQAENGNVRLYFDGKKGREYRVMTARLDGMQAQWSEADIVGLARGEWLRVSVSGEKAFEIAPSTPLGSYRIECRIAQ